jgi:phage gp29-like protein
VVHQPRLKSGLPLRNGLARLVAVMYMLKSYTVRDWWAFAEKFGIPVVVGKYGNNASPEQIRPCLMPLPRWHRMPVCHPGFDET